MIGPPEVKLLKLLNESKHPIMEPLLATTAGVGRSHLPDSLYDLRLGGLIDYMDVDLRMASGEKSGTLMRFWYHTRNEQDALMWRRNYENPQ